MQLQPPMPSVHIPKALLHSVSLLIKGLQGDGVGVHPSPKLSSGSSVLIFVEL